MSGQKGSLFIASIGDGGSPTENFTEVLAARSTGLSMSNEAVEITAKDSSGWRELLANAGTKTVTLTLSGPFKDSAAEEAVRAQYFAGTIVNWEIASGTGDVFSGGFQVTGYSRAGEYNGEETFDVTLESSGAITFTGA